jgi:uncharacterized protein (DUF2461 family)
VLLRRVTSVVVSGRLFIVVCIQDEGLEPTCRGFSHARKQVLVGALRERGGVVSEPLLDDLRGLAGSQQARVSMAQVLQRPDPW